MRRKKKLKEIFEELKEKTLASMDGKLQEVKKEDQTIQLLYIKTLCNSAGINQAILKPFYEMEQQSSFETYLTSLDGYTEFQDLEKTIEAIMTGSVIILTSMNLYIIELQKIENSTVLDTNIETTIYGPQKALSESIMTNLNLIRSRYRYHYLIAEKIGRLGYKSNLDVCILYDQKSVNQVALKMLREQLEELKKQEVLFQALGEISKALSRGKRTLFPSLMQTQRPDRIAHNIFQGKVIILMEGSPFALIAPAVFFDYLRSMDDLYQPYWVAKFVMSLRVIGIIVSLILPGLYIGMTSYNPGLFRVQLALTIAGSRMSVPYPSFVEVIFMLVMMEMLVEASIRLPSVVGPTATTVGGLILGQAATDAGLVSNIMVIIVSAVAIANFVIPVNEMTNAIRVLKYLFLFVAIFTGILGVILSLVAFIAYLVFKESYGEPYLKLVIGKGDHKDIKGMQQ